MMSNFSGTVLQIAILFVALLTFWFISVFIVYTAVAYIFDFQISLKIGIFIFAGFLIFKMFYPKNVFKTR